MGTSVDQIEPRHVEKRGEKGQSIVELSLITPLLLIALYIPFDFGVAFYAANLTQNAVREVARIAATQDPSAFNATSLQTTLTSRLPSLVTIVGTPSVNKFKTGSTNCMAVVRVDVTVQYNFFLYRLVRLLGFSAPDSVDITRTTQMRFEYQPYDTTNTPCTA
jgi:Flp pilus assembly protein TadG